MSKVERLENEIQGLSAKELAEFRAWFLAFDWAAWDRQLEQDNQAGKLDALADEALREHAAGKTKPICSTALRRHSGPFTARSLRKFNAVQIVPTRISSGIHATHPFTSRR